MHREKSKSVFKKTMFLKATKDTYLTVVSLTKVRGKCTYVRHHLRSPTSVRKNEMEVVINIV